MRFLVTLALFLVLAINANAATVFGQVKKANGQPVSNAVVSIGENYDMTDVDGRYRIKGVPSGKQQTLSINKDYSNVIEMNIDIGTQDVRKDVAIAVNYWVIVGSFAERSAAQQWAERINRKDEGLHARVGIRLPGNKYYPVIVGTYLPLKEALSLKKRALQLSIIKDAYLSADEER